MSARNHPDAPRLGLSDTSPEAEKVLIELYRRMPGWQKVQQVLELNRAVNELALADIRRRYPQASERELFLRLASRRLPAETMRRVFDWDPDEMGY